MRRFACCLLPAALLWGQSAQFRFDPSHSGALPGPARVPSGLAWRVDTGGKVRGTPVVTETLAVFGNDRGELLALDPKDGRVCWRQSLGTPLSSPALAGSAVIVMGRDNRLRSFALKDGSPCWTTALGQDLPGSGDPRLWDYWVGSPSVAENRAFVGSGDGAVYAVDTSTGRILWRTATGGRVRSTPAVAQDLVYAGSYDGKVYALEAATGTPRWTFDTKAPVLAAPAVAQGQVVVGSRSAAVFSLEARTGTLKWRSRIPNGSWVMAPVAVAEDLVVVGTSDERYLAALDLATGKERWRLDTRYRVFSAPVIQGGIVHVGTEGAHVLAVDLLTGLVVGSEFTEGPNHGGPVPMGDRLLLGSDDHHAYAFRTQQAPPRSAPGIALPPDAAGIYQLGSFTLTLLRTGSVWSAEVASAAASRVDALGGDRFRLASQGEGQLQRDASGRVTGLRVQMFGQKLELRRVS